MPLKRVSPFVNAPLTPVTSSPPAAAAAEQTRATSPVTPVVPKETREFEHHRQRIKKAAETANLRMRKLASATKQLSLSQPRTPPPNKLRKGPGHAVDVADMDDSSPPDTNKLDEEEREGLHKTVPGEVNLADFIVTRKSRKGTDNGFELIPHVRSVIILDDNQPHDINVDEPWEYITAVDEDPVRQDKPTPISYAMVVARAA